MVNQVTEKKWTRLLEKPGFKWLAILAILGITLILNRSVFTSSNSIHYINPKAEIDMDNLSGHTIEQHFYANEAIRSISLNVYSEESEFEVPITVSLYKTASGERIGQGTATATSINQAATVEFTFPDTESFALTEYNLKIESEGAGPKLQIKTNVGNYDETMFIDGNQVKGRLIFKVEYTNNLFLSFALLTMLLLTVSLYILFFQKHISLRPEQYFLVLALLSGMVMTFIVPSGQEPDSGDHILRAFDVSYGNYKPLLGKVNDISIQMPDNFEIYDDTIIEPHLNLGLSRISSMLADKFSSDIGKNYDYRYKAKYSSLVYVPQGFGLYLGRVWNLNEFNMLSMARLFNLLTYIGLTYLSIKIIPVYKTFMLAVGLLPMSIYQASSISADAIINGFLFLFIALIVQLTLQAKKISLIQLILPSFLLYIVYLAKPAYLPVALLIFMIPVAKYQRLSARIMQILIFLGVTVSAAGLLFAFFSGRLMLAEGNPVYPDQLTFVLHNLIPTVRIFLHTLSQNAVQYMVWLNTLGWLTYSLGFLVFAIPIFLVWIGLVDHDESMQINLLQKILILLALGGTVAAIFIGLYIYDDVNEIGGSLMLGVQGRYFIPLFILPFLLIKSPVKFIKDPFFTHRVAGFSGLALTYSALTLIRMIY